MWLKILATSLILLILYLVRVHLRTQAKKKALSDFIIPEGQLPFLGHTGKNMSRSGEHPDAGIWGYLAELCQKFDHKPFVFFLFGSDHLIVLSSPESCLAVDKNPSYYPRGWGFKNDAPVLGLSGQVLFSNWGESWEAQRKRLHPHFHAPTLRAQYPSIVECCKAAELTLSKEGQFEMKPILIRTTLDVIFKHIFGFFLPSDGEFLVNFFTYMLPPEFQLRVNGFYYLPLPSRITFLMERKKVLDFFRTQMGKAKGFFAELEGGTEDKLNDIMGLVFAGFETTGNSICWLLYHLYTEEGHKSLKQIQEELTGMPTSDIEKWGLSDLRNNTKTLDACFKETLRLHSPATGHVGDSPEDHIFEGKRIPKGSPIYTFQWGYYLSPKYFSDPKSFKPERWLNGEVEKTAQGLNMTVGEFFHPFLIGPHTCIGKVLAEVEVLLVASRFISKFNFEFCGQKPKQSFSLALGIDQLVMKVTNKK